VKAVAATHALNDGAAELDMVLPVGLLKAGRLLAVEADIRAVVAAARDAAEADEAREDVVVKVILETALLDAADIAVACVVAERAGADFVKTSTGFAEAGATLPDVALMRQMVGDALGVKAAGGIRTFEDARQMLAHGATRLGASASVALVEGASVEEEGY
jgi:deoxyribose-phosphate aldolase